MSVDQTVFYSAVVAPGSFPAPAVGGFGRIALFAGIILAAGYIGLAVRRRR